MVVTTGVHAAAVAAEAGADHQGMGWYLLMCDIFYIQWLSSFTVTHAYTHYLSLYPISTLPEHLHSTILCTPKLPENTQNQRKLVSFPL